MNLLLEFCLVPSAQRLPCPLCSPRQWPCFQAHQVWRQSTVDSPSFRPAPIHKHLSSLPFLYFFLLVLTQDSVLYPTPSFLAPQGPGTSRHQLHILYCVFNPTYSTDPSQKHRNKFNSFPLHTKQPQDQIKSPLIQYPLLALALSFCY